MLVGRQEQEKIMLDMQKCLDKNKAERKNDKINL